MLTIARAYAAFVVGFIGWAMFAALRDHATVPSIDDSRILIGMIRWPFWEWVFSLQNGHRVPGTLLLFAADYHVLDGQNHGMIVASLVTLSLALAVLFWAARTGGGLASPLSQMVFAAVAFGLFWVASCFNLLCGVCHANTAVLLFGFASLGCLVRYAHGRQRNGLGEARFLVLSGVAATLATGSMGQGVAIWPALILLAVVMRLPLRVVAAVVLAALVIGGSTAISVADFTSQFTQTTPSEVVFLHPLKLIRFVATLVGGVVGTMAREVGLDAWRVGPQNGLAGVLGLVLLAGHALWIRRHPKTANPHDWLAVGLMGFAVSVATGVGATRLFTLGFAASYAPRFFDWSGLFWVGALLSLTAFGGRSKLSVARFAATAGVVLLSTAILMSALGSVRDGVLEGQRRSTDASLAVLLGVAGPWELRNLYRGDPNDLTELFDRLKKERKSLYADPRRDWIGKPVAKVLQLGQARSCLGEIDLRVAEEVDPRSEWRISGWAWDVDADAPPRSVVLVDHRGLIFGLANRRTRQSWRADDRADWRGWVHFSRKRTRYVAYAVLADGRTSCRIAEEGRAAKP